MIQVEPVTLEFNGVRLEPLADIEIGRTWYAKSRQRSGVNTSCKLMLLSHAFNKLGCAVVGLRTDNLNYASRAAIERLQVHADH